MGTPPIKYGLLQCLPDFSCPHLYFFAAKRAHSPVAGAFAAFSSGVRSHAGQAYRRANAVHSALAIPYARFRALAARQLGIHQDVPAADLARAVGTGCVIKMTPSRSLLQQIENALHSPELSEIFALDLVQQLNRHMQNMKLIPMERQETDLHADRVPGAHARTN